ncbi:MAG: hypothetical protein NZ108_07350 [Bacteroidia bacterium]|nr:hypothetical protein [Bacteroidia bacterium]
MKPDLRLLGVSLILAGSITSVSAQGIVPIPLPDKKNVRYKKEFIQSVVAPDKAKPDMLGENKSSSENTIPNYVEVDMEYSEDFDKKFYRESSKMIRKLRREYLTSIETQTSLQRDIVLNRYKEKKAELDSTADAAIKSYLEEGNFLAADSLRLKKIYENEYLLGVYNAELRQIVTNKRDELRFTRTKYSKLISYLRMGRSCAFGWVVQNAMEAENFFEGTSMEDSLAMKKLRVATNNLISYSTNGTPAIFSEVYSDYVGPFRVGLGLSIAYPAERDSSDRGQKDAIQRFITSGGNASFSIAYPLWYFGKYSRSVRGNLILMPKFATDFKPFSSTQNTDNVPYNIDLGANFSLAGLGKQVVFNLLMEVRPSYVMGSKTFYTNIGAPEDRNQGFFMLQASLGMAIRNAFRISATYTYIDPEINNSFPVNFSVAFIPGADAKK